MCPNWLQIYWHCVPVKLKSEHVVSKNIFHILQSFKSSHFKTIPEHGVKIADVLFNQFSRFYWVVFRFK